MNKPIGVCLIIFSVINFRLTDVFAANEGKDVAYWTKMRMDYAVSKGFQPQWDTDSQRKSILSAHKEKKYEEAIRLGEDWLKKCPVDIGVHLILADSYAGLNDKGVSDEHMQAYQGLLGAIAETGDGRSEETPFSVISTAETHAVIQSIDAIALEYVLLPSGVERVVFKDRNNREGELYFKYSKEYWDALPS